MPVPVVPPQPKFNAAASPKGNSYDLASSFRGTATPAAGRYTTLLDCVTNTTKGFEN